jgi:hypothetical protein
METITSELENIARRAEIMDSELEEQLVAIKREMVASTYRIEGSINRLTLAVYTVVLALCLIAGCIISIAIS